MKGGFSNIMKQAQEMQAKMQQVQQEINAMEIVGEAGGGLVKVTMNGQHEIKRVEITPSVMQEEKELLEDLLAAAVNDANQRLKKLEQEKMAAMGAGINLPPGMKLPF